MKFQLQIGLRVLSKLFQIYIIEGILFKPSLNIVSNCIFFGLLKKKNTISGRTYKLKNVNFGSSETVNYKCSNQFIPFCHSQR